MSVSTSIQRLSELRAAGLEALMPEFILRWRTAGSVEERLNIEGEVISWFQYLLEEDPQVSLVAKGDSPLREEIGRPYDRYYDLLRMSRAELQKLTDLYISYYNSEQLKLLELQGKLRRVQQKRSALSLWESDFKYVLADRFLNHDWLALAFASGTPCNVDTTQGLLTLPIESEDQVSIKNITIGSGSNGSPGNSDAEVNLSITNPNNVKDDDTSTWFEYERLDAGPAKLVLNLDLGTTQIVNCMRVHPVNLGASYNFEIEDVLFTVSGGGTQSIKTLVAPETPDSFWTVQSTGTDVVWSATFLPVQVQSISIKFIQRNSYSLETLSVDRRTVLRDRFAFAIKEIKLFKQKYLQEGVMGSVEREYPEGLYAALPVLSVHPPKPALFDIALESSTDGGGIWELSDDINDGIGSTLLLDGSAGTLAWRMKLMRSDDAFSNLTDLVETTVDVKETKSLLRTVSRFQSPALLSLKEKPLSSKVFAMQTKLGRRGDRYSTVALGTGTGTNVRFDLPFGIVDVGLEPTSMKVYVNRTEYTYVEDSTAVGAGEWALTDDFKQVMFSSDLPDGASVRLGFDEERMEFTERSDGFFHRTELLFDPDKENIFIYSLPRESKRVSKMLPRDKKIIYLGYKNIEPDNLTISTIFTTLTPVATKADVTSLLEYYLDPVNGILYLYEPSDSAVFSVSFLHQNPERLAPEGFSVVYEDLKPVGILIKPEYFEARTVTQTAGVPLPKRINPLTGVYEARDDIFSSSSNVMTLAYDYIVRGSVKLSSAFLETVDSPEEVPFMDGRTEFLGLIQMENETTVEIEADGDGLVTFSLAAGALYEPIFEVIFGDTTVFATRVFAAPTSGSSEGDYYVSREGQVIVKATSGLEAGISINYLYKDPNFSPDNKYSVDYENGYLYTYAGISDGETVEYKVASYKLGYDIAQEIDSYNYDSTSNTIELRTEGLKDLNSLVKVLWERDTGQKDIRLLKDYFSPLISIIGYRFS